MYVFEKNNKKQEYTRLKVYMMCRKKTEGLRVEGGAMTQKLWQLIHEKCILFGHFAVDNIILLNEITFASYIYNVPCYISHLPSSCTWGVPALPKMAVIFLYAVKWKVNIHCLISCFNICNVYLICLSYYPSLFFGHFRGHVWKIGVWLMETIAIHCQGPYALWKPALFVSLLWKELGYLFPCILLRFGNTLQE